MGGDDLIFDTNSTGTLSENGNAIGIPAKETNIFTNPSDNPIIQVNRVASVIKKKTKKNCGNGNHLSAIDWSSRP